MLKKISWAAAILAACMTLTAAVCADENLISPNLISENEDAAEEIESETEEIDTEVELTTVELSLDGKEKVTVTSSVCDLIPEVSLEALYDSTAESMMTVAFDEEVAAKTINVYAAVAGPVVADEFAFYIDGEDGTVVGINVYATNDSTLTDWYQLSVVNPVEEKDGFRVLSVKDYVRKFTYFRFEFTVLMGDSFSLSEIALFCDKGEASVVKYTSDGEVEEGTTPDSVTYTTGKEKKNTLPAWKIAEGIGTAAFIH